MSPRATRELVVMVVAVTLGTILVIVVLGVVLFALIHPDRPLDDGVQSLGHAVTVLLGVVAGYVAGDRTRNGSPPPGEGQDFTRDK